MPLQMDGVSSDGHGHGKMATWNVAQALGHEATLWPWKALPKFYVQKARREEDVAKAAFEVLNTYDQSPDRLKQLVNFKRPHEVPRDCSRYSYVYMPRSEDGKKPQRKPDKEWCQLKQQGGPGYSWLETDEHGRHMGVRINSMQMQEKLEGEDTPDERIWMGKLFRRVTKLAHQNDKYSQDMDEFSFVHACVCVREQPTVAQRADPDSASGAQKRALVLARQLKSPSAMSVSSRAERVTPSSSPVVSPGLQAMVPANEERSGCTSNAAAQTAPFISDMALDVSLLNHYLLSRPEEGRMIEIKAQNGEMLYLLPDGSIYNGHSSIHEGANNHEAGSSADMSPLRLGLLPNGNELDEEPTYVMDMEDVNKHV